MALDSSLVRRFKGITRFNLEEYLLGVEEMTSTHSRKLLQYYGGISKEIPSDSITLLTYLVAQSDRVDYIINLNVRRFTTLDWWDLLELLESIKVKLKTLQNMPKWSRVSVALSSRSSSPEVDVQLIQSQTIESLLREDLGYSDENQDWYDIAIRNDIREEDYTTSGGKTLKVSSANGLAFEIQSIVDIIDKETIKGKDLHRKFSWIENDIRTIESDECFLQSVEILASLKKRDNPEFVSQGVSPDLAIGQNINSIAYPLLLRQLTEVFSRDDSIGEFSVTEIKKVEDGVFIEMEIVSLASQVFNISKVF